MAITRLAVVLSALWIILVGQVASVEAQNLTSTQATDASRAESAYAGMQNYFYVSQSALYRGTYPQSFSSNPYSYHWPFSQAMAATLDMYGLSARYGSAVTSRLTGLTAYWDGTATPPGYDSYVVPPYGQGGAKFYDDNAWSGLGLERAYRMTGNASALSQAEKVFTFNWSGWASTDVCSGPARTGGVFWVQQTPTEAIHDRNTVSDAPNAELALRLYQDTGKQSYLDSAIQIYGWVNDFLRDPSDGLYWDHVGLGANGACTVETTKWSYNQGAMIGVNVLLYQITGRAGFVEQAESIANAALARYGCVDGCTSGSEITNHGPAFNAVFFRNLLFLSTVDKSNTSYRRAMQSYADLVWNDTTVRTTTTTGTLFSFKPGYVDLLDQAAMIQIYAGLSWNARQLNLIV